MASARVGLDAAKSLAQHENERRMQNSNFIHEHLRDVNKPEKQPK
jgi:hypothetical protein